MKKVKKIQILFLFCFILLSIFLTSSSFAGDADASSEAEKTKVEDNTPLTPPTEIKVIDTPNDAGDSVCVIWKMSPSRRMNSFYVIYQALSEEGPYKEIKKLDTRFSMMTEEVGLFGFTKKYKDYQFYKVKLTKEDNEKEYPKTYYKIGIMDETTTPPLMLETVAAGTPEAGFFKKHKTNNLIFVFLMFVFVFFFINKAKRNPHIFLRKIAGLEAIEEAVGRSTEMGKPILYLTGSYDVDQISTISSVNILSHVAKTVANYDSRLIVPCKWPVAMTVCQEVVREAYLNAGRVDHYNQKDIYFIAGQQFSFTAAVGGVMMREKPAANFLLGTFGAESLILAEMGALSGAIQISGTDSIYQIPFFVVACDYCLIGEELYAASAYLSREPKLLGTLKAQDMGKILLVIFIMLGLIMLLVFHSNTDVAESIMRILTPR